MYIDQMPIFKTCPMCERKWENRESFLDDPELEFIGYQADFGLPEDGLFYFTHEAAGCGSTMAVKVEFFLSLYAGKRYTDIKMLSKECPGYCLNRDLLQRCKARCRYAYVREVSQVIKDRMKNILLTGLLKRTDPAAVNGAVRDENADLLAD